MSTNDLALIIGSCGWLAFLVGMCITIANLALGLFILGIGLGTLVTLGLMNNARN